jgi:NTP pyrophosphatase (non-canonical NTP hydrolase)
MNLDDYQKRALKTDSYDSKEVSVTDPAFVAKILGLVGEAGEVAEKFKKIIRNKNGQMSASDRQDIVRELGDLLWYTAVMAHYLDTNLDKVAKINLEKLADRHDRGVIKSSGDNR